MSSTSHCFHFTDTIFVSVSLNWTSCLCLTGGTGFLKLAGDLDIIKVLLLNAVEMTGIAFFNPAKKTQ
jgi:hypothetical protein